MPWLIILLGIALLGVGFFRIYLERRGVENEDYNKLKELNQEMDYIIKDIYNKKNKIKEGLELLEEEIDGLIKNYNNKLINNSGNSTFQEVYKEAVYEQIQNKGKRQLSEKYLKALDLYKKGFSINQIAREMNLGIRETEIIFKIYGKEDLNVIR